MNVKHRIFPSTSKKNAPLYSHKVLFPTYSSFDICIQNKETNVMLGIKIYHVDVTEKLVTDMTHPEILQNHQKQKSFEIMSINVLYFIILKGRLLVTSVISLVV